MPLDQLNSFIWIKRRYLTGPDPVLVLEAKESTVRSMIADGTFRGFGKLHRVEVQEYGQEPRANWRTNRGQDDPDQNTG